MNIIPSDILIEHLFFKIYLYYYDPGKFTGRN